MINATIIKDSVYNGIRVTTFELEYPRFIHSEFMTHRMFSRNAASSRAIPIKTMNENILANPAMPVYWGKNQPGMSAKEEITDTEIATTIWLEALRSATNASSNLAALGVHKQITNRLAEPFQHIKVIVTATEWSNWYALRTHRDAQPEIQELAVKMFKAHMASTPQEIKPGDWHLPYIHTEYLEGKMTYSTNDVLLTLDEAKMISASCCAQVSYRKNDDSLEKAKMIFDKLICSVPQHASPVEHQCTPMQHNNVGWGEQIWEKGITHCDRLGQYWSGNLKGWIQYRQLI